MPLICYKEKRFGQDAQAIIDKANDIISEYEGEGLTLTLRQLYYQFVARDLLPNTQKSYDRLGVIISDARLAGLVDWQAIEDRTRNLRGLSHWSSPADIVAACAAQFRVDKWESQPDYVEVWIEKDALVGLLPDVCNALDVSYFSCRGYTSQSELWRAGVRMVNKEQDGKNTFVIHLGDHDPSGIDMSRDIQDRLAMFGSNAQVVRVALTMQQVEQYAPPPNPAKLTDSRCEKYLEQYGNQSWELDALDPRVIRQLIKDEIGKHLDQRAWDLAVEHERHQRHQLSLVANNWQAITDSLE